MEFGPNDKYGIAFSPARNCGSFGECVHVFETEKELVEFCRKKRHHIYTHVIYDRHQNEYLLERRPNPNGSYLRFICANF